MIEQSSLLLILAAVLLLTVTTAQAQTGGACTLCFDGETITKPDVVLDLTDPISIKTCQDLADLLLFIADDDELCTAARSLSTLCGCPNLQVTNACSICESNMARPLQLLDGFVDLGDIDLFGLTPTCALVESGINVFHQDDEACLALPFDDLQRYCGCQSNEMEGDNSTSSNTCTLCPGGEIIPDLPLYDVNTMTLNSVPAPNGYENRILCQEAKLLVLEEEAGSALCNDIQRGSTICGCPVPENGCRLCPDDSTMGKVTGVVDSSLLGIPLICITALHQYYRFDRDSPECQSLDRSYHEEQCGGCQLKEEVTPCTFCALGESVPDPNRRIPEGAQGFGYDHIEQTCGGYEEALLRVDENEAACSAGRILAKVCGCSIPETACSLCQGGEPPSNPYREYQWTFGTISNTETFVQLSELVTFKNGQKDSCEMSDSFFSTVFDIDDDVCYWNQLVRGTSCGCSGSINTKVVALIWTQRCSGLLSLIGSISIIVFVLRKSEKARWNTYNQIVLSISVFDSLSSLAYVFGTAFTPAALGVYGSVGNEATCKFQGWLFQVGVTSIYYNVVLCFYFLFVVKYNWKERKFEKVRKWIHLAVILVGIAMSLAIIPFVTADWRWCYVNKPPYYESWLPGIFFFILPIGICMVGMTVLMIFFVRHIREVEKKSQSRRFPGEQRRSLANRTFWQSFYFLAAFYTVWPIQFVAFILPLLEEYYWVYLLAAILGPLQGFLNALVIFYRDHTSVGKRILRLLRIDHAKERWSSMFMKKDATASSSCFGRAGRNLRRNIPRKKNVSKHIDEDEQVGCSPVLVDSSGPMVNSEVKQALTDSLKSSEEEKVEETGVPNGNNILTSPQDGDEDNKMQKVQKMHDEEDDDSEDDDMLIGQFMEKLGESSKQLEDGNDGDAILEYAATAGILDDSDYKYFHRRFSSVYGG